jgi:hypothetical protein
MVTDHTQERGVQAIFTYRSYSARERNVIVSRGKETLLAKRDNYFQQREGIIVSKGRVILLVKGGNIVRGGWGILSAKGVVSIVSQERGRE